MGGGLVYLRFKFQPKEKISPNYVSYPFPRNEPEILEKFLGASFRDERVKRHCERLNFEASHKFTKRTKSEEVRMSADGGKPSVF